MKTHLILVVDERPTIALPANVYRELRGPCRENLQYLWKRAVRITEKPYTPQRERLCILWQGVDWKNDLS